MPSLPLAGPSCPLRAGRADLQRTIGWMPVLIESGDGKGGNRAYLKQQPGLVALGSVLPSALRGLFVARDVLYAVAGAKLYRISSSWVATELGTLASSVGIVDGAANNTQLCIVDGANGYTLDLDTGVFAAVGSNWRGSTRVDVLDGYGVFADPDSTQFYLSANQDFSVIDALDFASAEGSTGNIIGHIVKHRELLILKQQTGEVWNDVGGVDFPLARNDGANIETGLIAPHSLQKVAGSAFWLGQDAKGEGIVFSMQAYQPIRVSSHALEEQLAGVSDLSGTWAWTYHQEGLTFYVLQVPGLSSTWVYELASGTWHERAEWVNGDYQPWRASCHALAYGVHVVGDSTGQLYELSPTASSNAGDVLIRDRITPHNAMPTLERRRFGSLQVDCTVGLGITAGAQATLMLRYSDNSGASWSNWRYLTLGAIGEYLARARATMLGAARDRVWHIRVTDDVRCDLLSAILDER